MITRTLEPAERIHGACIGAVGMAITLFLGGALSTAAQWLLGLVPYGMFVWAKLLFWVPGFSYGAWLLIPAALAGAWKGDVIAFEWSIVPWGTSDQFGRLATVLSWAAVILICMVSEWVARAL